MLCLADIHANANGVDPGTPVLLLLSPECECSSPLSVEQVKWVHEQIIESSGLFEFGVNHLQFPFLALRLPNFPAIIMFHILRCSGSRKRGMRARPQGAFLLY